MRWGYNPARKRSVDVIMFGAAVLPGKVFVLCWAALATKLGAGKRAGVVSVSACRRAVHIK